MDWIDDIFDKIKQKAKNKSLSASLAIYLIITVISVLVINLMTQSIMNRWIALIVSGYNDGTIRNYSEMELLDHYSFIKGKDKTIINTLIYMRNLSVVFYTIIGVIVASKKYYNDLLRVPINILMNCAKYIGNEELTFECNYASNDEMGKLCNAFEHMRLQLLENNNKMWDMMEEQKRLNSVFAHDLRTPLTIIKGYTDYLKKYHKLGKVNDEKLYSTIESIEHNTNRLILFTNTMKELNSTQDIIVRRKLMALDILKDEIEEDLHILCEQNNKIDTFQWNIQIDSQAFIDSTVILEVFHNLLSNSIRFARQEIEVYATIEQEMFILYVKDDGMGFWQDDIDSLTKPYYSNNKKAQGEHFGIGLTICELLCKKHGGNISFSNGLDGGAIVCVTFSII